jgi:hypothetical protein
MFGNNRFGSDLQDPRPPPPGVADFQTKIRSSWNAQEDAAADQAHNEVSRPGGSWGYPTGIR